MLMVVLEMRDTRLFYALVPRHLRYELGILGRKRGTPSFVVIHYTRVVLNLSRPRKGSTILG